MSSPATECLDRQKEGKCDCYMAESLETDYPLALFREFSKARLLLQDSDPGFCEKANSGVCSYFETHSSCCCTAEAADYRRCLFDNVFVPSLSVPSPCKDTCGLTEESFFTIERILIIAGSGLGLILLLFFGHRYFSHMGRDSPQGEKKDLLRNKHAKIDNESHFKDEIDEGDKEQVISESKGEIMGYSFSSKLLRKESKEKSRQKEKQAADLEVPNATNAYQSAITEKKTEVEDGSQGPTGAGQECMGEQAKSGSIQELASSFPSDTESVGQTSMGGASMDQTIKHI